MICVNIIITGEKKEIKQIKLNESLPQWPLLLTLRQFFLISPSFPVSGLMLPILIMDVTKFAKKSFWLLANR